MFLGRELELAELSAELKTKKKSAILVYGKRRIGKSSLIEQAAKSPQRYGGLEFSFYDKF